MYSLLSGKLNVMVLRLQICSNKIIYIYTSLGNYSCVKQITHLKKVMSKTQTK